MSWATSRAVKKASRQPVVGIEPLVGRRAVQAHIVELDLADIEDMEFLDHVFFPRLFMAPTISEAFGDRHAMINAPCN